MAETYTKLFRSMLLSSIWSEDNVTRIVWITLLAESDQDGRVYASIPGLASLAKVSIDELNDALLILSSPDPYSKTPDDEGRRIREIDGGWELINHGKYREKMSKEDQNRKAAERMRRYRERKKQASSDFDSVTHQRNASVTRCNELRMLRHTDTDTDTDAKADTKIKPIHTPSKAASTSSMAREWFSEFWSVVHVRIGKQKAFEAFGRAVKRKSSDEKLTQREAKDAIVEAMTAFAKSPEAKPADRTPIHPTTWLNQGRYDDDRSVWAHNSKPRARF